MTLGLDLTTRRCSTVSVPMSPTIRPVTSGTARTASVLSARPATFRQNFLRRHRPAPHPPAYSHGPVGDPHEPHHSVRSSSYFCWSTNASRCSLSTLDSARATEDAPTPSTRAIAAMLWRSERIRTAAVTRAGVMTEGRPPTRP